MMRVRLRTLEAMALLLAARFLVRFVPLRSWSRLLGTSGPYAPADAAHQASTAEEKRVHQCSAAVRRAAFRLPGTLCLPQAIGLRWMLKRRRIENAIIVGILPAEKRGSAHDLHAWVEWQGHAVLGDSGGNHASLLQFRG